MTRAPIPAPSPTLDLVFERIVPVRKEQVWSAWTTPKHLMRWFTPLPWTTVDCEIDLRPGGIFRTVMRSPEGQDFPNLGCYLEVLPNERLIWTAVLGPGFRPSAKPPEGMPHFPFTAVINFTPHGPDGASTRYTGHVMHADVEGCKTHEAMGFHDGWGKACEQLVEVAKTL